MQPLRAVSFKKKQQKYIKDFQQEQSESDSLEFEFPASIILIN